MKDKLFKVKRKRVDWVKALKDLHRPDIDAAYYAFLCEHRRFCWRVRKDVMPSKNRAAYCVLKRYYSTTAMLRYRLTGSFYEMYTPFLCA